jgi:hypothetical protein
MKDHSLLISVHFIFCVKYRKRASLTILVFVFMVRTNTLGLRFFKVSLVCPCKFSPWAIGQCPHCRFPMRGLRVKFFNRVQRQTKNGSNLLQTKQLSSPPQYETHHQVNKVFSCSHSNKRVQHQPPNINIFCICADSFFRTF